MAFWDGAVTWLAALLRVPELWVQAGGIALLGGVGSIVAYRVMRFLQKQVAERTRTRFDDVLLGNTALPVARTIAFLGAYWALKLLYPDVQHDAPLSRFLITGLLIIWGMAGARLVAHIVRRAAGRAQGGARVVALLSRLVNFVVAVIIALTVLTVWDISVTPVVASAGIIGIALALAAQDTLANFFAGIAIYLDQPYQIGDYVLVDAGGSREMRGEVRDIGLRSTRILTREDVLVTVPNSVIANGAVVNESGHAPQFRIALPVSVAYGTDLDAVEALLVEVGKAHPSARAEPEVRARVRRFNDSGIDIELLLWIQDPRDRGVVLHELAKNVHRVFNERGITIPFPQRDIHVKNGTLDAQA